MPEAVIWQRAEGLIVFAAAIALFWYWNDSLAWWSALLIFFVPDLSFSGYLLGPKVGAGVYNAVHIYAFGAGIMALGVLMSMPLMAVIGALFLGHSGFDRMLGYGLKLPQGFGFTHLGRIGRSR